MARFGGTATTTINAAGNITGPGTLSIYGLSTLQGSATTTDLSVNGVARFGGTATTTISAAGNITQPTTNSATTTITVGCIQAYATSTATAVRIEFGANALATSTFRTGGSGGVGGLMAWSYGTCP